MEDIQRYVGYVNIFLSKLYENPKEMDFADSSHYRVNQMLLLFVTLWPYEHSMLTNITRVSISIMMMSFVLVQLTPFFTYEYTVDFFIMIISYAVPSFLCLLQYYYFFLNFDKIKQIWRSISENWTNLKNETECNIMRQYSFIGELSTICIALLLLMAFMAYASIQFLPSALDIILPLNEPRPRAIYALTEYFIDSETYYYPILFHWLLGIFLGGISSVAAWTFILVYIYHICGLLKIACYRIEQSLKGCRLYNSEKEDRVSLQKISDAVDIHRKALKYADLFMSTFESLIALDIILGAASLALNWVRLMRAIMSRDINNFCPTMMIVTGLFILMFLPTYYGQQITDHNNEIFGNVYDIQWYMATIKIQKLLLFIMKRTTKAYSLNIKNLIIASTEEFAKFFKFSMSYLMILYSLIKE